MPGFLYCTPSSLRRPPSRFCILIYLEQLAMWMAGPRQSWPPQRGRGESQARARQRQEPELSPSKCSHGCHGDHWPKPPSRVTFRTCRYILKRSHKSLIEKAAGPRGHGDSDGQSQPELGGEVPGGEHKGFSQDTRLCSASRGSCWSCPQACCTVAAFRPSRSTGPVPPGMPCQTEVLRLKPAGLSASPVSSEHI